MDKVWQASTLFRHGEGEAEGKAGMVWRIVAGASGSLV